MTDTIIKHDRFNGILVEDCKKLGGRWNRDKEYWEFSKFTNLDKVRKLDSLFNENLVDVEITAKESILFPKWLGQVYFFGYKICEKSADRFDLIHENDNRIKISDKINLIIGNIISTKEKSEIPAGTTFKLKISKNMMKKYKATEKKNGLWISDNEKWDIKILDER